MGWPDAAFALVKTRAAPALADTKLLRVICPDAIMRAFGWRRSTKSVYDEMEKGGAGLRYLNLRGFVTSEGGELLMRDGKVIGAIGMSGGSGAQDGQCSRAGVAALGK